MNNNLKIIVLEKADSTFLKNVPSGDKQLQTEEGMIDVLGDES
jgi:hypothetical protein